tara:strand:- start:112 stop:1143 length:1032 start_codon:yes stop_codon:yes gene_type:complete
MTTKIPIELSSTPSIVDNGDATAITIDSSENVGIGTSSPNRRLTVFKSSSPVLNIKNSDADLHLEQAGQNSYIGNSSTSGFLQLFTNNGNATVNMLANGNVGIGTTSPASKLHIKVGTDNNLEIEETSGDLRLLAINDARNANVKMEFAASTYEFLTGYVGINTSSPSARLEAQETTGTVFAGRFFHGSNPNSSPPQGVRIDFGHTPNNGTSEFLKCRDSLNSSAVNRAVIMSNGGIGNYTTNDFNYSDERMKKDISNATAQLDNLKKLQLKTFRYKEQEANEPTNLGVVAQDIQTDFPALVTEQGEGDEARLGVKEQQIMWMAVKAIQELSAKIEELEGKIE